MDPGIQVPRVLQFLLGFQMDQEVLESLLDQPVREVQLVLVSRCFLVVQVLQVLPVRPETLLALSIQLHPESLEIQVDLGNQVHLERLVIQCFLAVQLALEDQAILVDPSVQGIP